MPVSTRFVISHADIDHFNGAAGLMESVPVGRLLVSQQFLDFRQPAVKVLCDASAECGVPIKLVREGDRLRLGDDVAITVLHPPFGHPHSDDNANSIVLLIEYAGRRILLTGDLDGSGQSGPVGEAAACTSMCCSRRITAAARRIPPALADWATPVVRRRECRPARRLQVAAQPPTDRMPNIFSTHEVGGDLEITGGQGAASTVRTRRARNSGRMGSATTLL